MIGQFFQPKSLVIVFAFAVALIACADVWSFQDLTAGTPKDGGGDANENDAGSDDASLDSATLDADAAPPPTYVASAIGTGTEHSCAVVQEGGVVCWGYNEDGQLGDGTTANHTTPVVVKGLHAPATALALGDQHTCALEVGGGVECWGNDAYGQLGDNQIIMSKSPTAVMNLPGAVNAITAGGQYTCAVIDSTGAAYCWGENTGGSIGSGSFTPAMYGMPQEVTGLSAPVIDIATGADTTCAVTADSMLTCWGARTSQGQENSATAVTDFTPLLDVASGHVVATGYETHFCAKAADKLYCWGNDQEGELGDGEVSGTIKSMTPVSSSLSFASVVAGQNVTRALDSTGTVWGWGLYVPGTAPGVVTSTPTSIPGVQAKAISAKFETTCVLTLANSVLCGGPNLFGEVGNGKSGNGKLDLGDYALSRVVGF